MPKKKKNLLKLFNKYIKDTPKEAIVVNKTVFLCHLTKKVQMACGYSTSRVYVKTRVIKHLFDKKIAEEFHFILQHLHSIIEYVEEIYKNKASKRGDFCFVKEIKGNKYLASVEFEEFKDEDKQEGISDFGICVVTAFRLRKLQYLKGYKLKWSWRGDESSS